MEYQKYQTQLEKLYTEFKPAQRHFISGDEAKQIQDILGASLESDDLFELRNAVVHYCSEHYNPEATGWTEELVNAWDIMSAATAVIDDLKWKRGEAV